jgi:fermentation-respiration switch protein FrsA (DUF1100 family)
MIRAAAFATLALMAVAAPAEAGLIRDQIYQIDKGWPAPAPWQGEPPRPVRYLLPDKSALTGWYWPGTSGRIIIFFHGNGGNQEIAAHYAEPLAGKGDAVLIASYPGYGGNPGKPSETALRMAARAALAEAHAQGFADAQVYLFGYSLGAAVAIGLAGEAPVGGVITVGAFTRLADVSPKGTGWLLPDKFDNLAAIGRLHSPLLMFHATDDEVVPYPLGTRLFAAAAEPKQFGTLTGSPHRTDMTRLAPVILRAVAAMAAGDLKRVTDSGDNTDRK